MQIDSPANVSPLAPRMQNERPVASAADLALWLTWEGDEEELRRALQPIGVRQQYTLAALHPAHHAAGLWRVAFAYAGREPDRELQLVTLLRRIGEIARWHRVERMEPRTTNAAARSAAAPTPITAARNGFYKRSFA